MRHTILEFNGVFDRQYIILGVWGQGCKNLCPVTVPETIVRLPTIHYPYRNFDSILFLSPRLDKQIMARFAQLPLGSSNNQRKCTSLASSTERGA